MEKGRLFMNFITRLDRWEQFSVISSKFKILHSLKLKLNSSINECQKLKTITVNFIDKDEKVTTVEGNVGDNIMKLAQKHHVDLEGACAGSLACTTCHVYLDDKVFDAIPEACEKEDDLLDTAPFLKETSRLSCEVYLDEKMLNFEKIEIRLPAATKNFYVDGKKPTPH